MAETITIEKKEYEKLKEKARLLENIVDEEGLTESELKKIRESEKSKTLPENEAKKKYHEFFK